MFPYTNFIVVTPSNTENISVGKIRGIMIDHTDPKANIAVANEAGTSVTLTGLATGVIHPISTERVFATGTTATTVTVFY